MRVRQRRGGPRCSGKEADDEVGVVYFGERYLIPRIGRWASPDPAHIHALEGGEALNSYHYVAGNLLQARDPLGLCGDNKSCPENHPDANMSSPEGGGVRAGANYSNPDGSTSHEAAPPTAPAQPKRPAAHAAPLPNTRGPATQQPVIPEVVGESIFLPFVPPTARDSARRTVPIIGRQGEAALEAQDRRGAGEVQRAGDRAMFWTSGAVEVVNSTLSVVGEGATVVSAGNNAAARTAGRAVAPIEGGGGRVLFGQRSVGRTFTSVERGSTFEFAGESIADVARGLRAGTISPDQLPVRFVEISGQRVAVNNRSLTALRRAGMEPTRLIDQSDNATAVRQVMGRLREMGNSPSETIRIRGMVPNANGPASATY